jgi:hypothetical protein
LSILAICNESISFFIGQKGFKPEYMSIEIINIFQDVKWYFPKMKNGQLLTVPLHDEFNPPCAYFVKEVSRQSEVLQLHKVL